MPPNGSELLKWGEDVYVGATYAVIIIIPWPWICRQMRVNAVLSYPTWFLCYSHMATKYSMASSLSLYFWALKSPSKNGLDRNMPRPHVPLLENSTGLCKDAIYIYIYPYIPKPPLKYMEKLLVWIWDDKISRDQQLLESHPISFWIRTYVHTQMQNCPQIRSR